MNEIEIKRVGFESLTEVQEIFEATPDYFLKIDGEKPQKHYAAKELSDVPPQRIASYQKIYFLIYLDGKAAGVLDLHKNHPREKIGYIGLLLITPEFQGKGLGRKVFSEVEKTVSKLGINEIFIAIHERNDVTSFWIKMGFKPTGKITKWAGEKGSGFITEYFKKIK